MNKKRKINLYLETDIYKYIIKRYQEHRKNILSFDIVDLASYSGIPFDTVIKYLEGMAKVDIIKVIDRAIIKMGDKHPHTIITCKLMNYEQILCNNTFRW